MVHYCDVNSLRIGAASAKKLGTENDFFLPETEAFLNQNIETPLSRLVSKIVNLCNDVVPNIIISEEETSILKDYILSLLSRNNLFQRSVKDNFTFGQFLPDKEIRSFSVQYTLQKTQTDKNPFQNYNIGIIHILRKSIDRSLVVPRNGFYMTDSINNSSTVVAPLSPNSAVCLCDKQNIFHVIDDDASLDDLNLKAFFYEKQLSQGFIATNNKQELQHIKHIIESMS